MSLAANVSRTLSALTLLSSLPAVAAESLAAPSPLPLSVGACLTERRREIEQVVSLELARPVLAQSDDESGSERATVQCVDEGVLLTYSALGPQRSRSLELSSISREALARTVALALVELIEAPEPAPPPKVLVDAPKADTRIAAPARERPASSRAAVVGTARFFPGSADVALGARLRSRLLPRHFRAVLLGVGGERGRFFRTVGDLSATAAYTELGLGYDLFEWGRATVEVEVLTELGYVVLEGRPERIADTQGRRLTGVWSDLQLGLAPRFRLLAGLELTARAGLGHMLVAPAATFDGANLGVWRGTVASADGGLCLAF